MKLQRMDLEKQYKFHSYKYSPRFRHHYEVEIQASIRKNHKKKSKLLQASTSEAQLLKDHENIKEEKDIEVVMEEPLMRYNSCTSKKYKKKEIVRVDDVLIKNVSISNIDNVLWNSIEKLYRVNNDFVRLSDKLESDNGPDDF
ncbi:MAG: hypothetical protein EZS28_030161 [Streblomastix strix]|uniref:Uncharacterized protein n=1 Tax=Streblomastix strix TaxID=222440 RepID=A0A5J4UW52_9EUKA|nr:MAG: hypothetical protein EZS28_030161 [Streblomastix strix]